MAVNLCRKCFMIEPFIAFRTFSSSLKLIGNLEANVHNSIESGEFKPRKHPGILKSRTRNLPEPIQKAIKHLLADRQWKEVKKEALKFNDFLNARKPPTENHQVLQRRALLLKQVEDSVSFDTTNASEEEVKYYDQFVNNKVDKLMKRTIYNWKMINYSRHLGLLYLASRASPEYAILSKIFLELSRHQDGLQPETLFDFGSGVGTVIWAAHDAWSDSIKEYYCIDSSQEMSDISSALLETCGYDMNKIHYRQFLPSSSDRKYDIVVSAFSLLELPSSSSRLQTIANLWNKTGKYLVLIERGSRSSFEIINEAREFLLSSLSRGNQSSKFQIFSPCPHEKACPRMSVDNTPCNFPVSFFPLDKNDSPETELFTYIVFSKGKKTESDRWPRIVRPVLERGRHAVCKLCTQDGTLENITFSPTKPNKPTYLCAKASRWGDLLPVKLEYVEKNV